MTLLNELRQGFLFEQLTDEQLGELVAAGSEVHVQAGETLFGEGAPADFLWVLLEGELEFSQHVSGRKMILMTTDRLGAYAGGFRAYGDPASRYQAVAGSGYRATTRALRPSRMFLLPSPELARLLSKWFPMAKHLLDGLLQTVASIDRMGRERESLVALGTIAAGLAHELNNPASAVVRANEEVKSTLGAMQESLQYLAASDLSPDQLQTMFALLSEVGEAARDNPALDPLSTADREDEITDWLRVRGVEDGWKLAPTLVAAGLDSVWLEHVAEGLGANELASGLRWISGSLTTSSLLDQIDEAAKRISDLVRAVKEYSYMDRAPVQDVDVHAGLESTLIMLSHKLKQGVEVIREFDPSLPSIEAYGSELNQVWLNLLDNAVDAMGGSGQIRIHTARDGDGVLVEIADHGPGVPDDFHRRIFEPFFTTKEPGKGTGLGLDIVRRIVVERHGGNLSLESVPGDTRFMVRLPLRLRNGDP